MYDQEQQIISPNEKQVLSFNVASESDAGTSLFDLMIINMDDQSIYDSRLFFVKVVE